MFEWKANPSTLVRDFLEISAARTPDKVALICGGERLTYAEIESRANRLAHALIERGLRRGDRLVIHLSNSSAAVVAIFAVSKAGGVFVVVNPTTKADKLAYILNNCQAQAFIGDQRQPELARYLLAACPNLDFAVLCQLAEATRPRAVPEIPPDPQLLRLDRLLAESPAHPPPRNNIDLDLACLIYTSGSTGEPKGVMSDHSNVVFAASSIIAYLENTPDDIVINVLPLSFDYGLYQLLMTFKFGGTLVLEHSFTYPGMILQRIEAERVTGFPGVPTIYSMLLRMDLSAYDLSSLRYLTNTAAALPPSHILALRERFPQAKLYSMYGLTETKRTLYLPPEQLDKRPGSVGIPIPGTEAWIEDEAGNRLSAGEVGELVVRGRHVMRGYWGDPAATALRFRPGALPGERLCYTGDLFRMDEDGFFYFVGRKDDIIKSRGEKVAPKEVENVLYALPGVLEAAVVGRSDAVLGEAIVAFIVQNGDQLTESDVLAHCRAHLEDFMVPQQIIFRSELPKTESGKIKKSALET